jgi:hypothetical protein
MDSPIIRRILREAAVSGLWEALAERLSLTDLQSLLLDVYKARAARVSPAAVLKQYQQNRFTRLANVSPVQFGELDQLAYSLLPAGFEAVELSPVSPLGACSVIAGVDQNNTVATVRNTEVCADSTNVLALECASRREKVDSRKSGPDVKLCASHRLLRGQLFEGPVSFAHFRVFGLCTAGRDRGSFGFEVEALVEQIDFYLRLLAQSERIGCALGRIRVTMTPFAGGRADVLERAVMARLAAQHPQAALGLDQERQTGRGYYVWAGFQIFVEDSKGAEVFLVDGGFTDWTQKLLSDRKERLLISGMGTERFMVCFKPGTGGRGATD